MTDVATSLEISGGILVGHDGSAPGAQAVRWAAEWSARVGCALHVVRTWVISSAPRPTTWSPGYVPPMVDFEQAVLDLLRSDVDDLELPSAGHGTTGPTEVRCHVLHGSPGRRLVEASELVELVVVSARGTGGFRDLVLGSTADQLVRHAHCPVVVIPARTLSVDPADPDSQLKTP